MKKSTKTEMLWQQRVEAWRASGLKQIEWCRQNDVEANRFWYWRRKLELISANANDHHAAVEENKAQAQSGFAPVAITPPISPEPASPLTVALPSGLSISGINSSNIMLAGRLIGVLV